MDTINFYWSHIACSTAFRAIAFIIFLLGTVHSAHAQQLQYQQARQKYQQGLVRDAIPYFEDVLEADSLHLPSYVFLASSYLRADQPTLAETTAERGLNHFPKNLDLQWLETETMFQEQRYKEARSGLKDIQSSLRNGASFELLNIGQTEITTRLAGTYQSEGAQLLQQGQPQKAVVPLKKAMELQPDSAQHYINLAFAHVQAEQWDQALKISDEGLDRHPNELRLIRLKSRALYEKKDLDKLLEQYRELHRKNPDDFETAMTYGELLSATGNPEEAGKLFDRLLREHPRNPEVYRLLIRINERRMNYQGKLNVLKRMRQNFPQDDTLMADIATTHERLGEWKQARASYDTLLTMTGDTLEARRKIAETWRQQDSLKQATRLYRNLHGSYPDDRLVMLALGELEQRQENWSRARNIYEQLVRQDTTAFGLIQLGKACQKTGSNNKAISHYQQALELGSQHPLPHLELSRLMRQEQPDRSFNLAIKALELSLTRVREVQQQIQADMKQQNLLQAGIDRRLQEDFETYNDLAHESFEHLSTRYEAERVIPVLQRLTGKYSQSGRLYYLVGTFYDEQGQIQEAVRHYQKAIRYNDNIREAHLALARHYEGNEQTLQAIRSYERALTLDPESSEPYSKLINLYRERGRLDALCDRWLARYRSTRDNDVLREHLIEALHKANRFEEARKLVE